MNRSSSFIVVIFLFSFLISCRKEREEETASVVGYWKGGTGTGPEIRMLQRPDGSGRVYYFVPLDVIDTATATFKFDGIWQLSGNRYTGIFLAQNTYTLKFSAIVDAPTLSLSGPLLIQTPTQWLNTVFSVIKE